MGKKKKQKEKAARKQAEKQAKKLLEKQNEKCSEKQSDQLPQKKKAKSEKETRKKSDGKKKAGQNTENVLTLEEAAALFRALADESRMQILKLLEERELCGMELLQSMNIVQSTLSHHMRVLTETGLVRCRREGKKALYSICQERMEETADFLCGRKVRSKNAGGIPE